LFSLVADFKGVRRTTIELADGERPEFQLGPVSRITITPIIGRDGVSPISVHNATMSFAGHRNMGHTSGRFADPELGWDWELGHADWGPISVSN
jgi:hypothetical protein